MTMCRCQMRGCDHCDVRRVDGMIGIRLSSLAKCHKISSGPCPTVSRAVLVTLLSPDATTPLAAVTQADQESQSLRNVS